MPNEQRTNSGDHTPVSGQPHDPFSSLDRVIAAYRNSGYVCDASIATTLYVAQHLGKPILVEGPAGVGKTELAKATATVLKVPLIRLQCYEGLDESKALYEWKYGKQLLYTRILKERLDELVGNTSGLAAAVSKLHDHT